MDRSRLIQAIEGLVGHVLAEHIVHDFSKLRLDVLTGTLERTSPGKFVESFVDCLCSISEKEYSKRPAIDHYLDQVVVNETNIPEGLRVCGNRVARAIYTLRNKRSIAHRNMIDPNRIDLAFTYHAAGWIMAELIRCSSGSTMEEASNLIGLVTEPIELLVEDFNGQPLVLADVSTRVEILLLLHYKYPEVVYLRQLYIWVRKKQVTIRSTLHKMRAERLVFGDARKGFKLTSLGRNRAIKEIRALRNIPG